MNNESRLEPEIWLSRAVVVAVVVVVVVVVVVLVVVVAVVVVVMFEELDECRKGEKKLRGLSPRANYTDRAAAAGRRS